mmetsp:Transcript_13947/g.21184  ORF Transcript_13947/g.21184 Transcript_13947/m.21184 type:complete len:161 (+) Transcript_13947:187-669(+)|eukprot:CAMPEP_0118694480 /NCGR_PEP_ID=MMETSP0800-20121206/12549_1 /TAXON_ID=210618 ORGANISM="Striatella unipunctata, Strain CCMP2910" /NCGR_SAMPLE_ID=MMETSP0800 /ASSEMBLY_ACC=CAM_ASM_000638 /LENGTH=160 /DNA_ID=CAMNT_0006592955 /DNA_START=123 /DNA_END=605 /DNA_ORIENTATION=+
MMRSLLLLFALVATATSFAPKAFVTTKSSIFAPPTTRTTATTRLSLMRIPDDQLEPDQLEEKRIAIRWKEVKMYSREKAEKELEPEWLEAYNRFYAKIKYDLDKIMLLGEELKKIEQTQKPTVKPKSKKQRKRDKWAWTQAYEARQRELAAVPTKKKKEE